MALAEEEHRHYELFQALAAREDTLAYVGERIRTPSSDHRFCDYVHLPELGEERRFSDVFPLQLRSLVFPPLQKVRIGTQYQGAEEKQNGQTANQSDLFTNDCENEIGMRLRQVE